ncbi:hypothetical protein NMD97_07580 [Edwardsiella tarda]
MALSTNLLRARSYIATLCGFLLALGIVLYVERHQPPPAIPLTPQNLGTDFPALPPARASAFKRRLAHVSPGSISSTILKPVAWLTPWTGNPMSACGASAIN